MSENSVCETSDVMMDHNVLARSIYLRIVHGSDPPGQLPRVVTPETENARVDEGQTISKEKEKTVLGTVLTGKLRTLPHSYDPQ